MALSEGTHHSFDKVAAGEKYDGLRAQKTDSSREAANRAPRRQRSNAARDAVFFELFDEDTAGVRPEVLAEPRPQERVQRHVVEHIVDYVCCAPLVQILDAPVPQMVDNLMDTFRLWDRPLAEQVIEVPEISFSSCPSRVPLHEPQKAEQLVEVPTILSFLDFRLVVAVFMVFSQDRIQQRCLSRTFTFQFVAVELIEVF